MVFGELGALNAFSIYNQLILECVCVFFLHDSIKMEEHWYSSLAGEISTLHMHAHTVGIHFSFHSDPNSHALDHLSGSYSEH